MDIKFLDEKGTDTTRYLCAAAHLDQSFCNQVIDQILEEEYRAISASAGVDLLTVVKHCLASRRRKNVRDLILAVMFLVILISLGTLFIPLYIVATFVVFRETWITRYKIIAKSLLKSNFNPDYVTLETDSGIQRKLLRLANSTDENTVVYSGFSPFVGSGYDAGAWSFVIDISRGKEEFGHVKTPQDFTIRELHNYITQAICSLSIYGLSIQDRLYVNGKEIRDDKRFLPDILGYPFSQVSPSVVSEFIERPTETIRHYKTIRVVSWKGDIVLSIFLRFIKLGSNLFTEVAYFLLPPIKDQYRMIDTMQPEPTVRKVLELYVESALVTILLLIYSPFAVVLNILRPLSKSQERKKLQRLVLSNPSFDYGATTNIRELASSNEYRQYFQKLDKEMYAKIIERQILDKITDFLDGKNVDTSELRDRQTAILNNGVFVTGGSVEAQNLTVGDKAKTFFSNVTQAAPKSGAATKQ